MKAAGLFFKPEAALEFLRIIDGAVMQDVVATDFRSHLRSFSR